MSKSDLGNETLSKHRLIRQEAADLAGTPRSRVVDESTADWLLLNGHLSIAQYDTISKLKSDLFNAGLAGLRASDYQPRVASGNNQNISTDQALKRLALNDAIKYLDKQVGRGCRKVELDMALDIWDINLDQLLELHRGVAGLSKFYDL
mgnify:FL=1